jgi:hypothetical protein
VRAEPIAFGAPFDKLRASGYIMVIAVGEDTVLYYRVDVFCIDVVCITLAKNGANVDAQ